jgi:hypothetical protein
MHHCRLFLLLLLLTPLGARAQTTTAPDASAPPAGAPEAEVDSAAAPVVPPAAAAGTPVVRIPPEYRIFYRSTLAGRYNPIGLFSDNRVSFRRRLYESDNAAFNNNFAALTLFPSLSPAFSRIGFGAEFAPASFLNLWGNMEFTRFFGTFNLMQSFPGATSDYSDTTIGAQGRLAADDPLKNYGTFGTQLNLGAELQFRVGPIAVRNQFRTVRADYQLRDGDSVFYEQAFDVLVPNRGWYLYNDSDLLFMTSFGLTAGVRMNVAHAFYGEEHLLAGERLSDITNGAQTRLGPLVAYTFYEDEGALVDRPTLFFLANWWLNHRFRTGVDTPQALPMIAVALQVQGDFIPWNRPAAPAR